jgi:hypothetical protein
LCHDRPWYGSITQGLDWGWYGVADWRRSGECKQGRVTRSAELQTHWRRETGRRSRLSAGIPDKLACRVLRVGAADQDAAVDRREQARARRVDVSAGASGRRVMDEDVLGERIRSQSEDLARAFVGYRKAFQSASSKDSDFTKAQETNARQDAASSMPRRHSRQCSQ